jgi:hypothetical protein
MTSWQKTIVATSALGLALAAPGLSLAGVHVSNIIVHPDPPTFTPIPELGNPFPEIPIGGSGSEMIGDDTITVAVAYPTGPSAGMITITVTPSFTWDTAPAVGGLELVFTDFPALKTVNTDVGLTTAPGISDANILFAPKTAPDDVIFAFATSGPTPWDSSHNVAVFDFTTTGFPIPEPTTWVMMLVGFAGIGAAIRRRAKTRALSAV